MSDLVRVPGASATLSPFLLPDGMSLIFSWLPVSYLSVLYSRLRVDRVELHYSADVVSGAGGEHAIISYSS